MIDKEKIKIIMIIVIEILCLFIVFYTLSCFQYNVYAAEIKEYSGIDILYTKEFENDMDHTYQIIAGTDVNVRIGPGIEYDIFTVFEKGKPIDNIILEKEYPKNKWIKFWYGMNYYYIYDDYLKVIRRNISRTNG